MKVSYDILQKFVAPPRKFTAREVAEALTMGVVEVEGYEDQAERLRGVVVGLVTEVRPHPSADRLKLLLVDCGGEAVEVVCGGVNARQGMKVALAKVGSRVRWHGQGEWVTLAAATIRGVESNGMACAADELGLPDPSAVEHGIMDLSYLAAKPGTPLSDALGMNDIVFEIDNKSITHRPDLWGHLGLARELAALWRTELHPPRLPEIKPEIDVPLMVSSRAGDSLVRYLGVAIEGLAVTASPAWLQQALTSLGVRPINNVVDVTNYVMFEFGQPLHAFDLAELSSPEIVVRYAKPGEALAMLDGVTRKLTGDTLLIADRKKALAVAGVMGGEATGVSGATTAVVLESATFEPVGVRRTATRLGLRTEASMRFEKALDHELAELALKRTVALLAEVCPGCRVVSPVVDVFPKAPPTRAITLSLPWLYRRLGTELPAKEVLDILHRLGFGTREKGGEVVVTVPPWRATRDITTTEDVLEEVARLWGYNRLPRALPSFDITPPRHDELQDRRWRVRDELVAYGFTETLTYSFVGGPTLDHFGFTRGSARTTHELCLELENPTDQSQSYLRPALLPNLLAQAGRNSHHREAVRMFELGRVFVREPGGWLAAEDAAALPKQPYHLGVAVALRRGQPLEAFRELKGVVERLGLALGTPFTGTPHGKVSHDWCEPGTVLDIKAGSATVGHLAVVRRSLRSAVDLPTASAACELSLDALAGVPGGEPPPAIPPPQYPGVERDLSLVVPPGVSWASLEKHVRSASQLITAVEVFDVYPEKGSLAFRMTFRHPARTLTGDEVEAAIAGLSLSLQQTFGVTVRT